MRNQQIKVWDLPVRLFHWLLVLSFTTAYITEDNFLTLHSYAGYSVFALISFRLLWGFVGSYHAQFCSFVHSPRITLSYLNDIAHNRAKRFIGHNPAGAAMVVALLISLLMTTLTGMATFAVQEFSGPLVWLMNQLPAVIGEGVEEAHEFFSNFTLVLIVFHLAGVLLASISHRENLVKAMLTGMKYSKVKD